MPTRLTGVRATSLALRLSAPADDWLTLPFASERRADRAGGAAGPVRDGAGFDTRDVKLSMNLDSHAETRSKQLRLKPARTSV